MNFLRRALAKHEATGLSILRHPLEIAEVGRDPRGPRRAHPEPAQDQLHAPGRSTCRKALLPTDLMALRMADLILLVAQLELSACGTWSG